MVDRPQMEQALAVLDTYQRQIEALSRQFSFLQAILNETVEAREALEGLRREPGKEILVPLGSNTFLYANAANKEKVLTGIGAGLSLERNWQDAERRLAEREREVQKEMERLSQGIVQLQQQAAGLQEELQADLARFQGPSDDPGTA